jgi:hypothetical protein
LETECLNQIFQPKSNFSTVEKIHHLENLKNKHYKQNIENINKHCKASCKALKSVFDQSQLVSMPFLLDINHQPSIEEDVRVKSPLSSL